MSTVILISFVLPTFFVRDWLLLRMGPAATIVARLREYAFVLLASIVLFSAITFSAGTGRLLEIVLSPSVTLPVVLLYCVLLAVCIWIRRTERHQVAWRIALFPNPLLVLAIATLARFILPRASVFGAVVITPFAGLSVDWPHRPVSMESAKCSSGCSRPELFAWSGRLGKFGGPVASSPRRMDRGKCGLE